MALPTALRKQEEELKALEAELFNDKPAPDEREAQPEAAEQPEVTEPEPAEPPKAEKDDEPKEVDWHRRYKQLQGKYDAEVPRYAAEVRELKMQIAALQKQVEEAAKPPEVETPAPSAITEKDVEEFGADLIELQRRVAQEVAGGFEKELKALREQNAAMAERLTQVSGTSFEARLAQAVPDFKEINTDERWVAWLNEFDPMLRGPRRAVAQEAYANGDVETVKAYVDLFKQSIGEGVKPVEPAPQAHPDRQAELKKQVQPARSAAPASAPNANTRSYTMQQFQAGMNRAVDLMTKGRVEEATALEKELSAAVAEGRVQ